MKRAILSLFLSALVAPVLFLAGCSSGHAGAKKCLSDADCQKINQDPCRSAACRQGACSFAPVSGGSCDDGDSCTTNEVCVAGTCKGAPIDCNDENACTSDSCDSSLGCVHVQVACDDADACTSDSCNPSVGCVYSPVTCSDGNICTDDSCDPAAGCVFANNNAPCDDNDPCTAPDTCSEGACQPGADICHGPVTVMVYMAADNNLDPFAMTDLQEMQNADPTHAAAYDSVLQALGSAVYYERHGSRHPNAHGLAVYFKCRQGASAEYSPPNLQWAADTIWDDMLLAR